MDFEAIKSGLKAGLQSVIDEHEISVRSISHHSGCTRHFLRKILDNHVPRSLDISQVLLLTIYLSKKGSLNGFVDSAIQPIQEILNKVLAVKIKNSHGITEVLQKSGGDPKLFLILDLARCGVQKDFVSRVLGEISIPLVERLVECKAIFEVNEKLHCETDFTLTLDQVKKYSQFLFDHYYTEKHSGQERNYNSLTTAMVSVEQVKEYYLLCKEFHKKVSILVAKHNQNSGEIPIFVTCAMDSLVNELPRGENWEQ